MRFQKQWLLVWALTLLIVPSAVRAEFRTWTAAVGGFKTDAEFVELRDGNLVHLRLKAGGERDVPLDKLSAADQEYVRQQSSAATSSASASPRLAKLEHDAGRCRTAEEAWRLYRVFLDLPDATQAEKDAARPKVTELRALADKKMVRMNDKWVTDEEFRQVRNQANSLMKQGLELLRLKQEDTCHKKFAEAAALEPDSARADFLLGMIYGLLIGNQTKAKQHFDICLKRDPESVAVLNNLALTDMKRGDMRTAAANWRKAVELSPDQRIIQNLGRFLDQAGQKRITVPKNVADSVAGLYSELIANEKFQRADLKRGWMYILLDDDSLSLGLEDETKKPASAVPAVAEDGSKVIGGGTGFVVAPGYLLTNYHVVARGTSFDVQTGDSTTSRTFRARLVASSQSPDLALLHCPDLDSKPLALDPSLCGRGTDILALGYPEMFTLGASLKATRGVISAVPSSAIDNMYLYDATINPGNSGGPVCDSRGNVVAVTTIVTLTAGRYGGGIPSPIALMFVRKHVPNYQPPPRGSDALDWPTVDRQVSPSTVLIWARAATGEAAGSLASVGQVEDRRCLACFGVGGVKCTAQGCVQGKVTVRAGGRTERQDCPKCQGRGLVRCELCRGTGLDLQLIPPKATPNNPPSGNRPSTNPPPGNPPVAGAPNPTQPGVPARQYAVGFGPGAQMNFRYIEPGTFLMGGPRNGQFRTEGQTPHEVTLTKPYYIATTEVTQAQWMMVMGTNPSRYQGDPLRPVEHVTWNDCQQFIVKLNQRLKNSKSKFRLPTEAEWEYACRAGSTTAFSFGDDIGQLPQYGWFDKSSDGTTHPVGKLLPNAWNLFDMHGNVMEWCSDFYDPGYGNSSAPAQDPTGPAQGSERVTRGGCWFWRDDTAICGGRNHFPQNQHFDLIGFRLVCERQ